MTTFPPPPPRIHEEQIVLFYHDSQNNFHCLDKTCPCWADEQEDKQDETGTHPPNCRCEWCEPYEAPLT